MTQTNQSAVEVKGFRFENQLIKLSSWWANYNNTSLIVRLMTTACHTHRSNHLIQEDCWIILKYKWGQFFYDDNELESNNMLVVDIT